METAWHGKDMAKTGTSPALRLGQENGMARQASSVEQSKNRGGMQTEGPPFFSSRSQRQCPWPSIEHEKSGRARFAQIRTG